MKKIYISGPISGYDINERKDAFAKAQEVLELCGYEVRNPFDNGLDREASTHEHMRADLKMLLDCDEENAARLRRDTDTERLEQERRMQRRVAVRRGRRIENQL